MLPLVAMGIGTAMSYYAKSSAMQDQAVRNKIAAVWSEIKAADDAEAIRDQGNRFQANQAVGFAKSGVLIDSGSPLATLMDTSIRVERNALKTLMHGSRESANYEATASSLMRGASNQQIAGALLAIGQGTNYRPGYVPSSSASPRGAGGAIGTYSPDAASNMGIPIE